MAYFSLHAYDADLWIPAFKGLDQSDTGLNPNTPYASEALNVETPNGVLQPQAATKPFVGQFASRVETLAQFHRRFYTGDGDHNWYVCCSGGKLYQKQAGTDTGWQELVLPTGVSAFNSSAWSWVTYEINEQSTTTDVLLMSNKLDGMIMVVPPDRPTTYGDLSEFTHNALSAKTHIELTSPKWAVRTISTHGYKFGVIERYAERIWGGDVYGEPDLLVYSRPYDPTDWTFPEEDEQPEDGAGEIRQPSWDGASFCALKRFGDHLLAFKKNAIWRVLGVSPGEYQFLEQYGSGTEYFNTIAVDKERAFMGSRDGLMVYDGMTAAKYMWEQIEQIWKTANRAALDQMCAVIYKNRYYFAFPTGTSSVNNAMLVYNLTEGTILFYKDFYVESFLPTDEDLLFTTSTVPGKIFRLKYDSWDTGEASGAATKWITPWMDFGRKNIVKGGFDLYMIPEVQDTAVQLKISVQTEKKLKTKNYTIQPLTVAQRENKKEHRGKRLHFGGSGRKFRIIIETEAGVTAPWRLVGGIQMIVETDPD